MFSTTRSGRAVLAATSLAVLLSGCGGTDAPAGSTPGALTVPPPASQTPSTVTTPTGPASSAPTTTSSPAADVTLDITVPGGKVKPSGKNVPVKAGQTVRVAATSDVVDTIHVHGYDKELAMKPGRTTSLTFVADAKGSFEVETHESGKLVAKLIVS